jgi:hypothetical protein
MSLYNKAFQLIYHHRKNLPEKYVKEGINIQEQIFEKLLIKGKLTEFGKFYNFKSIHSIDDFQRQVPIMQYEDFYSWIEEVRKGKPDVLWPGKVQWLAKSSGTTNDKSKYIPVTQESLNDCHYKGSADVLSIYLRNYPGSKLFSGKTFTLGGSHQMDNLEFNIRCGDLSAILLQNSPVLAEFFRTPPRKIALIADWEEKINRLLPLLSKQNVTAFAGVPSWNLILLQKLVKYSNKNNLLEIWPNVELFMHGGVNFSPYRDQFHQLIPSEQMHYMDVYNASEGFFAIQNDPEDPSMLLMLDYDIFYEFIPMNDYQMGKYRAIPLVEVELNENYAMVISTSGGLWRYVIGDTVMFTSLKPYKIVITGRTMQYLNAFGEELMIHNTDKAIAYAASLTHGAIHEYTVAPVFMDNNIEGCHEWVIEFEKIPEDLDKFAEILDKKLMELNSDYEAKRYKDITLKKPIIHIVPEGTFYKWFVWKNKVGGQNKIPRLSNSRKFVEELLSLIN